MSDAVFVVASYAIVVGGLAAYAASIARRAIDARHIAQAIRRQRALDAHAAPGEPVGDGGPKPVEPQR